MTQTVLPVDALAALPITVRDRVACQPRADERVLACTVTSDLVTAHMIRAMGMGRPCHAGVRVLTLAPAVVDDDSGTVHAWAILSDAFLSTGHGARDVSARKGSVDRPLPSTVPASHGVTVHHAATECQVPGVRVVPAPVDHDTDTQLAAYRSLADRQTGA